MSGAAVGNRPAMPAIPDDHVVRVLRPFVAATGPVLRGLRDADPFRLGRLARRRALELQESGGGRRGGADEPPGEGRPGRAHRARPGARPAGHLQAPRHPALADDEPRGARRLVGVAGRALHLGVASIPGIGGALARRLPVSDILGLAAQGLVICAIAGEHGLNGRDEQVRLLASVLFGRDVDPSRHGDPHAADVEREAGELQRHGGARRRRSGAGSRPWPGRCGGWGRTLWGLQSELDRRPQGNRVWRTLANVPVVGAVGSYRSERSGLKRAARAAARWVAREQGRR